MLRSVRNRATITPVSPMRSRLIHISPSYYTIVLNYSRKGSVHRLEFKSHALFKSIASKKNIQSDTNNIVIHT